MANSPSPHISLFGSIYDIDSKDNFPLDAYLEEVKNGRYEDDIHPIRTQKSEKTKDALKRGLQRVTFSGLFSSRNEVGLREHSGFIAIDLDDLQEPEVVKKLLSNDRYVYAAFLSSGGKGLTVLFRILPQKHREAFLGISAYLLNQYSLVTDPGSIAVSKPFGVTFDPNLYLAQHNVPIFTTYPKERKVEKISNFAFEQNDFEKLLKDVVSRGVNLCENYDEWLKIGFAFASKFGEAGRNYYHMVSSVSSKYNQHRTDKQYTYCLKSDNNNIATISTFYWYCQQAGLQITSERTAKVRKATLNSKAAGLKKEQIIDNLKKFENIEGVDDLVGQIYDGVAQVGDGESQIEQLELFISANYAMERNSITRFLERDNRQVDQKDLNTIYISAKKVIPQLHYDLVERLLLSDFIKGFNPITRFFEGLPEIKVKNKKGEFSSPLCDKIAASIQNDIGEFTKYFFRKWFVSIVSAAHGEHSPLLFALVGEKQGKGKTEFFRRLFPPPLRRYYAESKLDAGKDDEILMTQKLVIMDDEMSGKSKKEIQRLKELTSKDIFSLREPYGRVNVDLKRMAVLAGTSNFRQILHDPTGNRRIIPIPVDAVDHELYNSVDKTMLFAEAHSLWKNGFEWRVISQDDIEYLRKYEIDYEALNLEQELIIRYFSPSTTDEWMMSSEIKVELEKMTIQRLSLDMIGKQLTKLNFEKKSVRINDLSAKRWGVKRINRSGQPENFVPYVPPKDPKDDNPF